MDLVDVMVFLCFESFYIFFCYVLSCFLSCDILPLKHFFISECAIVHSGGACGGYGACTWCSTDALEQLD